MGVKEKDKSLLEIAVELLLTKHRPQPILQIAKEAMEIKGLKTSQAKELLPQFLLDFQTSGYFVYCGEMGWDLKDRQPTSVLDKDGTESIIHSSEAEEAEKNELKDENYDTDVRVDQSHDDDNDQEEDDDISTMLKEDGELAAEEGVDVGYEEYEGEEDDEEEY
ncbi:MAG: DNA-directed RNA polymerase subunit delta [Bacilli bacterium]|nr:DNA-directed RNA polymerase subunit delta [Bacilli bacterium]